MSDPTLVMEAVDVRLGRTPVLRGLDLTVAAGEVVGIRGPNGSGKTTLLRTAATLISPDAGRIEVLGTDGAGPRRFDIRPAIGLIGHVPSLYGELTLAENIRLVARLQGRPLERVDEALDAVGLSGASGRRAGVCSFGMQRRAEFARILLTEPRLLLFDEAHGGLDRNAAELVEHVTKAVAARGGAALLVSHHEERIASFVHRTLDLEQGRLWTNG